MCETRSNTVSFFKTNICNTFAQIEMSMAKLMKLYGFYCLHLEKNSRI